MMLRCGQYVLAVMSTPNRKKPPVQYVRCEIEGCGTVLAHPRYLQVCLRSHEFFASLSVTQNCAVNVAAVFEKVMSIVSDF